MPGPALGPRALQAAEAKRQARPAGQARRTCEYGKQCVRRPQRVRINVLVSTDSPGVMQEQSMNAVGACVGWNADASHPGGGAVAMRAPCMQWSLKLSLRRARMEGLASGSGWAPDLSAAQPALTLRPLRATDGWAGGCRIRRVYAEGGHRGPGGGVASSASGSRPRLRSSPRITGVTVMPCIRIDARITRPTIAHRRSPPWTFCMWFRP